MLRRGALLLLVLLTMVLHIMGLPAAPAWAGEVPSSAKSSSMGVPPLLLDGPMLAFQFPQAAVLEKPFLLGIAAWHGETRAVGAFLPMGPHRIGVAVQRISWLDDQDLVQMAGGLRLRGIRLGAAVRGFRTSSDVAFLSPLQEESRDNLVEGSLGVGFGEGRRRFDLALGILERSQRNETSSSGAGSDSSRALMHMKRRPIATLALRSVVPVGGAGSWIVAADWLGRMEEWDFVLERPGMRDSRALRRGFHVWSAQSSVQSSGWGLDQLGFFLSYDDRREPLVATLFTRHLMRIRDRSEGTIGAFVHQGLAPGWTALGGVRASHVRNEDDAELWEIAGDSVRERKSIGASETLHRFVSWGLEAKLRRLTLVGSIDTTFDLDPLIARLDARFDL